MTGRSRRARVRQNQINILHTSVRKRHTEKKLVRVGLWTALILVLVIGTGAGLHFGISVVLDQVLFSNPRYALTEITIEPRGHFSDRMVKQAVGLDLGQNLWALNLPKIAKDLEKLPYVASAKIERHFPDKLSILIRERVPVVKIVGLDDLGKRETFYLDKDCMVLKPRDNEPSQALPEVIGLTDAELVPGQKLDQSSLTCALQILDAIDHTKLHTSIDIRTINLRDPLSMTMVTSRDLSITFRTDYIDQQLERLEQLIARFDNEQHPLHTVDLTPYNNVPITFYK